SGGRTENFLGNGLKVVSAGSTPISSTSGIGLDRLLSFFGRVDYNFREKYLFQFNMRYDGSTKFALGHQWGFFPSLSVGWRLSEEQFFKNIDVISNLKLRASWGQVRNNAIGSFRYVSRVS